MSFWGPVGEFLWGTNVDADTTRSAELDARIKEQNDAALAKGKWTTEQYEMAEANRLGMAAIPEYDPDLWKDFGEGAAEGLADMQAGVKGAVTTATRWTLQGTLGFVPWWVWVAGAAYVAFRLGLLKNLLKG
jgi:hypothetical protein